MKRGRNILYLITSSGVGGEEYHLFQLARWARDRGHGVYVCCLRERGIIGQRLQEEGFPLVCFNEGAKPRVRLMLRNACRLATLLRDRRIDLVHSFLLRANIEARLARRFAGTNCAVVNSEGAIDQKKSRVSVWLDRSTFRWCDVILANSRAVGDVLIGRDRLPPNKIRVVYQGIDIDRFKSNGKSLPLASPKPSTRDVVIGYVGRLHPAKGVRYLIEAAALVSDVTRAFQVVIVGDGVEAADLRALVSARNLADRVRFVGMQEDVAGFMRTFDILAIPSLVEGLPTVAMEALACSVPVVATDVGGTPEVNEHGRTGLLVPPGDAPSLATTLLSLVKNEPLRRRLGQSGPRVVEERFLESRMWAQTVAAYDEVLRTVTGQTPSAT